MPRIIVQKSSGTWWKVLLALFIGFLSGIIAVVGGVAAVAAFVSTKDIITMTGNDPDSLLTVEYQNKTALDIVMDAVGGNLKFDNLGDIAKVTPKIEEIFEAINASFEEDRKSVV